MVQAQIRFRILLVTPVFHYQTKRSPPQVYKRIKTDLGFSLQFVVGAEGAKLDGATVGVSVR